jgi:cysteinyl-tRNA synthetase
MLRNITFYNSRTRTKEPFKPIDFKNIKMYVCGPTVHDYAHLGNARAMVVFDLLYRVLSENFTTVTYVSNITDVDDKINANAIKNNESIRSLTERTFKAFQDDMNYLNVLNPTHQPRATDFIDEMIHMIQILIEKNHAYAVDGHVLFDVSSHAHYGALSNRSIDDMIAGSRVEIAPYKKNAMDFVLWKPSDDNTPGWQSPWGYGRPGWHIECSAMAHHHLGSTFDIHGGGIDLIFPHHENELAQSICANDTPIMANYWMHNGHLMVDDEKMAKSLGNFITVHALKDLYHGEVIRLSLLMSHYRQPLNWSSNLLDQAKAILDRFYRIYEQFETVKSAEKPYNDIMNALCDDMNTLEALAIFHQIANELTTSQTHDTLLFAEFLKAMNVMGLLLKTPKEWFQMSNNNLLSVEEIEHYIQERKDARAVRDFKKSDEIRNDLDAKGVILEDTGAETKWRYK